VLPAPPPPQPYDAATVTLKGCPIPPVKVKLREAGSYSRLPDAALHGEGAEYADDRELCFAIRALKLWADGAPLGEPLLLPGDGERIATYWREPGGRPPFAEGPVAFTLGAEIPGRPRPLWVQVDRYSMGVRFGAGHR